MSDLENDVKRSIDDLKKTDSQLQAAIAEEQQKTLAVDEFTNGYEEFEKEGGRLIIFKTGIVRNTNPRLIRFKSKGETKIARHAGLEERFLDVIANDVWGDISQYKDRKFNNDIILIDNLGLEELIPYLEHKVRTQTVYYLLKPKHAGKIRKIEHTRYLDINNNSPIAEVWKGISYDLSSPKPTAKTGAQVYTFEKP